MPTKGYDLFYMAPNSGLILNCVVCKAAMDCQADQETAMSWVNSVVMSGHKPRKDIHVCPYHGEEWHLSALEMLREIEKCRFQSLIDIMQKDLDEVVAKGIHYEFTKRSKA